MHGICRDYHLELLPPNQNGSETLGSTLQSFDVQNFAFLGAPGNNIISTSIIISHMLVLS